MYFLLLRVPKKKKILHPSNSQTNPRWKNSWSSARGFGVTSPVPIWISTSLTLKGGVKFMNDVFHISYIIMCIYIHMYIYIWINFYIYQSSSKLNFSHVLHLIFQDFNFFRVYWRQILCCWHQRLAVARHYGPLEEWSRRASTGVGVCISVQIYLCINLYIYIYI